MSPQLHQQHFEHLAPSSARPTRTYRKGRPCTICGRELSIYNPSNHCSCHDVSRKEGTAVSSAAVTRDHKKHREERDARILARLREEPGALVGRPETMSKYEWDEGVKSLRRAGHVIVGERGKGFRLITPGEQAPPVPEPIEEKPVAATTSERYSAWHKLFAAGRTDLNFRAWEAETYPAEEATVADVEPTAETPESEAFENVPDAVPASERPVHDFRFGGIDIPVKCDTTVQVFVPAPVTIDAEVDAIDKIVRALEPIDGPARFRVLDYAAARYMVKWKRELAMEPEFDD